MCCHHPMKRPVHGGFSGKGGSSGSTFAKLLRGKNRCGGLQKKKFIGIKNGNYFSILFIIPYLCRVFHADTFVRGYGRVENTYI